MSYQKNITFKFNSQIYWYFLWLGGRSQTTLISFWIFFDHLPPFVHTFYLIKVDIFDYLPTSACKRSLWTTPYSSPFFAGCVDEKMSNFTKNVTKCHQSQITNLSLNEFYLTTKNVCLIWPQCVFRFIYVIDLTSSHFFAGCVDEKMSNFTKNITKCHQSQITNIGSCPVGSLWFCHGSFCRLPR